jgi:hypothetical protein
MPLEANKMWKYISKRVDHLSTSGSSSYTCWARTPGIRRVGSLLSQNTAVAKETRQAMYL